MSAWSKLAGWLPFGNSSRVARRTRAVIHGEALIAEMLEPRALLVVQIAPAPLPPVAPPPPVAPVPPTSVFAIGGPPLVTLGGMVGATPLAIVPGVALGYGGSILVEEYAPEVGETLGGLLTPFIGDVPLDTDFGPLAPDFTPLPFPDGYTPPTDVDPGGTAPEVGDPFAEPLPEPELIPDPGDFLPPEPPPVSPGDAAGLDDEPIDTSGLEPDISIAIDPLPAPAEPGGLAPEIDGGTATPKPEVEDRADELAPLGNDPTVAPDGFDWRGKPGSSPGDKEGSFYNEETGEVLRPDLDHPEPVGPHWDFKDADGDWHRIYPDGTVVPK